MSIRVLVRIMFVVWAMAVAALSVISHPGSKDLLMSVKLTSSGFVVHGIAYFVGVLLCCFSFNKKNISFVLWTGLKAWGSSLRLTLSPQITRINGRKKAQKAQRLFN